MSYARSMEEAKAAIKAIEPENEANMKGSPILNGQSDGGGMSTGSDAIAPKNYSLSKATTTFKRTA